MVRHLFKAKTRVFLRANKAKHLNKAQHVTMTTNKVKVMYMAAL